jgi:hypothetical protein
MMSNHARHQVAALIVFALTAASAAAYEAAAEAATPVRSRTPEMALAIQSCNDAYDQTGVGGRRNRPNQVSRQWRILVQHCFQSGLHRYTPAHNGLSVGPGQGSVDGAYAFSLATGHPRPVADSFHSRLQLQGPPMARATASDCNDGIDLPSRSPSCWSTRSPGRSIPVMEQSLASFEHPFKR